MFGSRIGHIWALGQLSLCTHNPDRSSYNYFMIFVIFFARMAPHFFHFHDSPSNLAKSRYPPGAFHLPTRGSVSPPDPRVEIGGISISRVGSHGSKPLTEQNFRDFSVAKVFF